METLTRNGPASAVATDALCEEVRLAVTSRPSTVAAWLTAQIRAALAEALVYEAAFQRVEPPKETAPSRLLTPAETAALLRVELRWIRRHTATMPHRRIGKYVRFSEREVIRWYDARKR
jgi:hypothetical protein